MVPHAAPIDLSSTYARLRNDATVEPLPVDATFWPRLASGALGSFHHEYLVALHRFDTDWPIWEMHPHGDEVVTLISGRVTFILAAAGGSRAVPLVEAGQALVVAKGTWHTVKVSAPSSVLFITAGEGTQHGERPA